MIVPRSPVTGVRNRDKASVQEGNNHDFTEDWIDDAAEEARNPAGSVAEIRRYLAEGLDGFFTDDPALGRTAIGYQAKSADS